MKKLFTCTALAAVTLGISAPAYAANAHHITSVEPLLQGPPFIEVVSPYKEALECLATTQTPEQKAVAYAILAFPDKTARMSYSQDNAAGSFMSQGEEDMLVTSFHATGVQVVDYSPQYRQVLDWSIVHSGAKSAGLMLPDIVVTGSMNSLDFLPGGGIQLDGALKAGGNANRINIAFDARAVTMPFIDRPNEPPKPGPWYNPDKNGGHVISTIAYSKQVVQYGVNAGASGMVGGGALRTFLQLDWGHNEREALQYAGHMAADITAFRIVRDVTRITSCDDKFFNAVPSESLRPLQP